MRLSWTAIGWFFRPVRLDEARGVRRFIARNLAQQFALKTLLGVAFAMLAPDHDAGRPDAIAGPAVEVALLVLLVAPVLETILLQMVPIEACRRFGATRVVQFIAGSVPFAALHFADGLAAGVAAGVVGGAFFSHAYLECRRRSWWMAAWVTIALHGIHNLIVLPVLLLVAG